MSKTSAQKWVVWAIMFALVCWLVIVPIAGLGWGAFWSVPPGNSGGRLTAETLIAHSASPDMQQALLNTLVLAGVVTLISTPLGMLIAWLVVRTDLRWRKAFGRLMLVPIFLSPLVGVLAWIAIASPRTGFLNVLWFQVSGGRTPLLDVFTFTGMVLVMVLHYTSYSYLYGANSVGAMDGEIEEAARISGAKALGVLRRVTLPLIMPSLLASGLMIFVLSAEQFPVPGLLGRAARFETLPSSIYFFLEYTPTDPQGATVAGLILAVVALIGLVLYRLTLKQSSRYVTIGGKGGRSLPTVKLAPVVKLLAFAGMIFYLLLALVLPLAAIVFASFQAFLTPFPKLMKFTLDNYAVLASPEFLAALKNTGIVAFCVAFGVTFVGMLASYLICFGSRMGRLLDYLCSLPVAVPGLALAIGLLWMYSYLPLGLYGTIWILVAAYGARFISHSVRLGVAGFVRTGRDLDEAARIAGASLLRRFMLVHLPMLKESIRASVILLLIYSIIEVSSTIVLYTPDTITVSVFMWRGMQMTGTVQVFAIAVAQSALIGLLLLVSMRWLEPKLAN